MNPSELAPSRILERSDPVAAFLHNQLDAPARSRLTVALAGKADARMAIAQPVGTRGIEVLGFNDPAAARRVERGLGVLPSVRFDRHREGLGNPFP
jgi:hypothetical protein